MKRSIHKIETVRRRVSRGIRRRRRRAPAPSSVQKSILKWMDRSKDFVSTLPTLNELRDEFADWHSFEPIHLDELSQA
jgi:hypothetical protein